MAAAADVADLVALRAAVAEKLRSDHGDGPWARASTEKGVLFDMRNSKVFVAREAGKLIASLRLMTKKPWAIDRSHFSPSERPLYLLSMAVAPDLQRQGIGRRCLEAVREIGRKWPADAICLDAYAAAGAGGFYAKCGFKEVGRATYRGCPLAYYELKP
ncbi:MAG TPA: GNAT family N-acetyltransferase [Opitutaceae bacterium]|nr:GNAT family N-acetyltransferase [Opitutaceae bacterium]